MTRTFKVLAFVAIVLFGGVALVQWANVGTAALWNLSGEGAWLLPLVVIAALIDSINPCAFGILLLTIGFLLSLGQSRSGILKMGGVYIAGLLAVYLLIGLGIFQALHLFDTPHFMAKLGATLLIVLGGINLINEFFPSFPIKLRIPQAAHQKMAQLMNQVSLPGAFLLGVLVGLCEFPCTGGPYLMIIGLMRDEASYLTGVGYLVLYNLVFISPLVLILGLASDASLIDKVTAWKKSETKHMRLYGGIAMILLGLLAFTL